MNKQLIPVRSKMLIVKIKLFLLTFLLIPFLFTYSSVILADVWDKWDSYSQEYQENEGIEEFVWKEGDNTMPKYPEDGDLLEVAGPPVYRNYQYLIDAESLQVGADGVVRYSLVIRSQSGTDNVMYDGLRCTTKQIKNYAYGSTDMDGKKKFIQKSNPQWKPLRSDGVMGYGPIFVANYFCDHYGAVLKHREIIQNIKYGKGPVDGLYY